MPDPLCALVAVWLALVNADRQSQQPPLPALVVDADLAWYAQWRAEDMAARRYYGHDIEGHGNVHDVMWALGYGFHPGSENAWWCEDLAEGGCGTEQAHAILMASRTGHREAILDPHVRRAGFGAARDGDEDCVYVQLFATEWPWTWYLDKDR